MNSTDITVFYSTARVEAMERILKEQGKSLDSAVLDMLDDLDRKSTRLNSSHMPKSRMPSSA